MDDTSLTFSHEEIKLLSEFIDKNAYELVGFIRSDLKHLDNSEFMRYRKLSKEEVKEFLRKVHYIQYGTMDLEEDDED